MIALSPTLSPLAPYLAPGVATDPALLPLSPDDLAACRARGEPLGFDPVLQGWVRLTSDDAQAVESDAAVQTISFRPWAEGDLPAFRAMLSDPSLWRYLPDPFPGPLSAEDAGDLMLLAQETALHEVRAAVLHGMPIGQVRLMWDAPATPGAAPTAAEFSYWLGRAYRGRGYGHRIAVKSVALAFARHPDLVMLWARVHPDNRPSLRCLRAAGFTASGRTTRDGWPILTCPRPAGSAADRLAALAAHPRP